MALRSLLRRIPGPALLSPTGPRMGPGHGIWPSATSRFVCTRSEGEPKTFAELHEHLRNVARLEQKNISSIIDEENKRCKELVELHEAARLQWAEYSRAVDKLRKLGNIATACLVAVPALLIFSEQYEA